ncbi:MAG TPA: dihydropteroate synthase [Gammaproteobacteria bacterium]|nr:dihydropteroate synthase [Gammaproteobacteria bacterium]
MELDCNGIPLNLDEPRVMGVLNVTPDSFSDGGRFDRPAAAIDGASAMVGDGAAVIDVGGESTRPGAEPVPVQEELDRVIPVVEALHARLPVPISVDTSKPEVIREAARAGAGLINDVYGLRREGAVEAACEAGVPVCLMHMQGEPRTMQASPHYDDVVAEVKDFLAARIAACEAAGIPRERLLADPGFGFGKDLNHNLRLLHELPRLQQLGVPLLVGMSRKRMIGEVLDAPLEERLHGSVAVATLAGWLGAAVVRAHDVRPTVEALAMVAAVKARGAPAP